MTNRVGMDPSTWATIIRHLRDFAAILVVVLIVWLLPAESLKGADTSTRVTIIGVAMFVWFEWYRRPRLSIWPSKDGPKDVWIHLTVRGQDPLWRGLPRDVAADCVALVSFLDPATFPASENELMRIQAHWVGRPEPRYYYDIPLITTRNVGFREEMIDVLRRHPDDGAAYAADPWIVYRPPWELPVDAPADTPPEIKAKWSEIRTKLEQDWGKRRLKPGVYIVRVIVEPANGLAMKRYFRLTLPEGMGKVEWGSVDP
jgi:hypothetical protein